jgi:glutamate/tyrosine decarboxylase-like PLP-dependent enzyme
MGVHASYLTESATAADPYELVPEMSRRARGVPVWAVLRHLGRSGVDEMVTRLATGARALADRLAELPGVAVLNDVVFTQVCIALADDAATRALGQALRADGTAFASSSRWHDRDVLRFSVSNRGTDETAIDQTVAAVASALDAVAQKVR